MSSIKVNCGKIEISNDNKICIIAGPCQLESEQHAMDMAGKIQEITKKFDLGLIYKTSFDKANRTSLKGERGAGLDASIPVFDRIKKELKIPILTDIHNIDQCSVISNHVDVIQIPAFLCRQTDLIKASAQTKKIVNVKKGQFLSHKEVSNIINKIENENNKKILITERGNSFGYNYLINDFKGIHLMKTFGYPIIFDSTHSVQLPGGLGKKSGGAREYVTPLSKAASSLRIAGFFIETHPNPETALSDGPNMVYLHKMPELLNAINKINKAAK